MSIQNRAMLVSLSIGMFSPRKTDKKVTREVLDSKSAKQDAGKFVKVILPEEALKPSKKVESEARDYYYKVTCPWSDEGARILPSQTLMDFTEQMRRYHHKFDATVADFMPRYAEFQEAGRRMQGDMYNAADYPSEDRVRSKFYFKTAFLPFPDGSDFRVDVGDEVMAELRSQVEDRVREASNVARLDLWSRLETPLRAMAERLGDPDAVFRDTLVTNLSDIVGLIPALNITNDPKLDQIRDDIQMRLTCYRPESLRRSPSRRREAAAKANDILKNMAGYFQSSNDAPSAPPMVLTDSPDEEIVVGTHSTASQILPLLVEEMENVTDAVESVPTIPVPAVPIFVAAISAAQGMGKEKAIQGLRPEKPPTGICDVGSRLSIPARPALPAWRQRMQQRH